MPIYLSTYLSLYQCNTFLSFYWSIFQSIYLISCFLPSFHSSFLYFLLSCCLSIYRCKFPLGLGFAKKLKSVRTDFFLVFGLPTLALPRQFGQLFAVEIYIFLYDSNRSAMFLWFDFRLYGLSFSLPGITQQFLDYHPRSPVQLLVNHLNNKIWLRLVFKARANANVYCQT